jgi:hypothetical protein
MKVKSKRTRFELELRFRTGQRALSLARRRDLLAWLQRRRKALGNGHPQREFWLMTGIGEWERL